MKRITAFTAALFLVLGIAAANNFAQDDTMKQNNTMTKQNDTMMSSKKTMMKKHRKTRKHHRHRHHKGKRMMKKSTMK